MATKKDLEKVIAAVYRDINETYQRMKDDGRGEGHDEYEHGYMDACEHARDLLAFLAFVVDAKKYDESAD